MNNNDPTASPITSSSDAEGSASPSASSSSLASTSASTFATFQTDATAQSPTISHPVLDLDLKALLADLFGVTTPAQAATSPAPTPCFDPAVWAACRTSSAAMSAMTTQQLLIVMRMGAPYTVETFLETFVTLAKAFKKTYDELEEKEKGKGKEKAEGQGKGKGKARTQ